MSNNLLLQEIAIGLWAVHVLKKVIWNYLKISFPFIIELNKKKNFWEFISSDDENHFSIRGFHQRFSDDGLILPWMSELLWKFSYFW